MGKGKGVREVGYIDCAGGGQVVVKGDIAYIGNMSAPDGTVIINVGSKSGIKVGDTLSIKRKQREIRDPETGKIIRVVEDMVGNLTITEVDELSSVGKFTGGTPAKVGDTVSNGK